MSVHSLLQVINSSCPAVVAAITQALEAAGFQVVPTFDFQTTRAAQAGCTCPHHGTKQCDCQMVVLLVYRPDKVPPASLVVHGHNGQTWLSLAEQPKDPLVDQLRLVIRRALFQPGIGQMACPESGQIAPN